MKTIDIAFFYEHAARELDVASLIVAGLRKAGLQAEIIHWPTGFPEAVLRVWPKVVVLPFCYTEKSYEALLTYWPDALYFNMTWEQFFYPGNQRAKTPRGAFATQYVIHHAWSDLYADFLKGQGIPLEHIFVNGQPAYTLYEEPYCRHYPGQDELAKRYHLDVSRRWIFFPENYNWAFYSPTTLKQFIANGQSSADVQEMREFCVSSLRTVLLWCAQAAKDEEIEIILRPRPSTTQQEFEQFVRQVIPEVPPHLHIVQNESVREWILSSAVVVSSHSTSLIEAAVAGKDVYILEPSPIPQPLRTDWQNLLPHIRTSQAFLEMCRGDWMTKDDRLADWARQTLMRRGDSISNLTAYLIALRYGQMQLSPPGTLFSSKKRRMIPAIAWSIYRRAKQWFRLRETSGIEPEFVKDALPADEIEAKIAAWDRVLNQKNE